MNEAQRMVAQFHEAFNAFSRDAPGMPPGEIADFRLEFIAEELEELTQAVANDDLVRIADGLGDLLYVVYGAGLAFGIDLEPILAEIHRSNMTKLGGPVREDGKQLKPDWYEPPQLAPILEAQGWQRPAAAQLPLESESI